MVQTLCVLELRFLLVAHEDMSSCGPKKHVFLWHQSTCLLASQEDNVFFCRNPACLPVAQEHTCACGTGRRVFS